MKKLVEVINLIAEKYIDDIVVIIEKDKLILEYMYNLNSQERDVYKTLEITEFEDKLKVLYRPENIVDYIKINQLEHIFEILKKQSSNKKLTADDINEIKNKYVKGTKIKLIKMYDLYNDISAGETGVVTAVDDVGTIHVNWNNGSTLGVVPNVDKFEVIGSELTQKESKIK